MKISIKNITKNPIIPERVQEPKIPKIPKLIKINGNINFKILNIVFFIKIYLEALKDIKILSISTNSVIKTIENIKKIIVNGLFLINNNFGLKIFNPNINIIEHKKEVIPVTIKILVIFSFFLCEECKNLMIEMFKPNKLKVVIKLIIDIRVEANPISTVENNLVLIIQKKKPNPPITNWLAIK